MLGPRLRAIVREAGLHPRGTIGIQPHFGPGDPQDRAAAVRFIIDDDDALTGPVNLTSPGPMRQRELMRGLRAAGRVLIGLPATRWTAEIGALAIRIDTGLLLKSRRVVPARLTAAGFEFQHGSWPEAARDLCGARERTQPKPNQGLHPNYFQLR